MELVSIDVSDANGVIRRMLFWQDGDGNLVEVRGLSMDGTDSQQVVATLSDGTEHTVGSAENPMHMVGRVTVTGENGYIDMRGLASARPAANTVVAGSTYWSVDTNTIEVSDGFDWSPVS
ncbi:MAG TPA: hypothetical protein VK054_01575 [Beutenbergiaceae bacterium]|nr:hypothetical protein [Beutenbergiaceae bacterium]